MDLSKKLRGKDKSRIVLINLPTEHLKSDTEIMARGPLSLHSYLKKNGIDSILVDLAGSHEERWELIPDSDFYGISSVTCQIIYAEKLVTYLKNRQRDAIILMGGAHPTALPHDPIENRNVDIVVVGEGEKTLLEFMSTTDDISKIPGLYYKDKDSIRFTGRRSLTQDVEEFYPLRFEDYGIYRYLNPGVYKYLNKKPDDLQMNLLISRGCSGQCNFCMSGKGYPSKVRYRNIKNAVDEIIYYRNRYEIDRVYFDDDELLTDWKRLKILCSEMKRSGVDWLCLGRTDRINEEKLQYMVDSGCVGLVFGVESFDDKILKHLNKFNTAEANYKAITLAYKYGLKVRAQLMIGCIPVETWDSVKKTGEYVKKIIGETNGAVKFSFHIFQPLPGTFSYYEALRAPDIWDTNRLSRFSEFQTVGNFQMKENEGGERRPMIAHKNSKEVFEWYDYLVSIAGKAEVASV